MVASLRRRLPQAAAWWSQQLSAAALLASCGAGDVSGATSIRSPSPAQHRPPEYVVSYVTRVTEQFGQAEVIEWVWSASEPAAKDLNGGVMVGLQLLDKGAKRISGSAMFLDYAPTTLVRSQGYYIVAAQGEFAARPDHDAPPVACRTVLLLLAAVRVAGRDGFRMAEVGVYSEGVPLDLEGTQVYVEGLGPAKLPIDWRVSPL